jgi:membrane protein implicated in regulation of membrane protease activity
MATYVYWFLAGLVLLGLEMVTGTFYLLMLGIALGIGGGAALLGLEPPLQFALAALAGIVGTAILRKSKSTRPAAQTEQSLDIGQAVQVVTWHEDGTVRVHYRGAEWDAEAEFTDMPRDGTLYIKALRGSTLILTHHKP